MKLYISCIITCLVMLGHTAFPTRFYFIKKKIWITWKIRFLGMICKSQRISENTASIFNIITDLYPICSQNGHLLSSWANNLAQKQHICNLQENSQLHSPLCPWPHATLLTTVWVLYSSIHFCAIHFSKSVLWLNLSKDSNTEMQDTELRVWILS